MSVAPSHTEFGVAQSNNALLPFGVAADQWTHLVGSYDGELVRLYTNGVLAASTPFSGSIPYSGSPSPPLEIGYNHVWPDNSLEGAIDDVRVYDRALSPEEIRRLYIP